MTFDHVKQAWVKRKDSDVSIPAKFEKRTSEATEEDPFEDIPDLSVDELEELRRIQTLAIQEDEDLKRLAAHQEASENSVVHDGEGLSSSAMTGRPTRGGAEEAGLNISSVVSKYSRIESSEPITETRATSWGEESLLPEVYPDQAQDTTDESQLVLPTRENEIEHEISILEGRVSKTPPRSDRLKHRARVVTVAFSSPLVNHVQTQDYNLSPDRDLKSSIDACEPILASSPTEHSSGLGNHHRVASKRTSTRFGRKATFSSKARRVSIGGHSFTVRPVSRIDEHAEVSFHERHDTNRRPNLEVSISTPRAVPSSTGRPSNHSFHLSPLPDFTLHQLDESLQLDIGHVAKRSANKSVQDVQSTFSLAVAELVKKITDVEPFEPYWEYMRQLHLRGQGLITLHLLRDFCGRLEELDVSDNQLGQLNGAPSTIRHLKIQRNCLSNLTAWAHLSNLQFLDVSGNQIESLEGFSSLIHLRELRANDNKISSIEGVFELDGLISLSLQRNCLERVDFESAELYVLVTCTLGGPC